MHPLSMGGLLRLFFYLASACVLSCSPNAPQTENKASSPIRWVNTYGGTGDDVPQAFARTRDGNLVVAGELQGHVDFGAAGVDGGDFGLFVTEFAPDGTSLWAKAFPVRFFHGIEGVAVRPSGHVLVTGHVGGTVNLGDGVHTASGLDDIFLLDLDPQGAFVWARFFQCSSYGSATAVAVDSADNILLTGWCIGRIDFGNGASGAENRSLGFLAKLDSMGIPIFSRTFGDGDWIGRTVAVDAEDNVLFGGSISQPIDFGGGTLGSGSANESFSDAFVAALDRNGVHKWSKSFGELGNDGVAEVVPLPGGPAVVAHGVGRVDLGGGVRDFTDQGSAVLFKLDSDGGYVWDALFPGGRVWVVATGPDGRPAVLHDSVSAFSVATLGADGNARCSMKSLGTRARKVAGVAFDTAGNLLVAGAYGGTQQWDDKTLTAVGRSDIFLASVACAAP